MRARMINGAFLSQRTIVLGVIAAVHAVIVYGMADGLTQARPEILVPPIQTEIIQEVPRRWTQKQPVPTPPLKRLRVQIPPPEIEIVVPVDSANAITGVTTEAFTTMGTPPPPPSGPAPKPATKYIIHARIGKDFPNPDAFYPPTSVRREEQGL